MQTEFEYYYNNVPEKGLCRNNLIYTSLISKDKKTFCQWYHNDTEYHKGQNQVVDPSLMEEKWTREINFILKMKYAYPEHIPEILDIDYDNKKLYLKVEGPDMWELAGCQGTDYSHILSDWDTQMLDIIQAHKKLGIYKYSMHPSSYFIVDGKLKSINYFFTYGANDHKISLRSVMSHISEDRQKDLFPKMAAAGIDVDKPTLHQDIQKLAFDSFKTNFRDDVMEKAKQIYE
jgi:hypothetical protein